MRAIDYARAKTVDEAVSLLKQADGRGGVLAGGTDVIVQLREYRKSLDILVDIKEIPEANELTYDPVEGLRLGAAVPCYKIYQHETVARLYQALIDSASLIGGTQIQGRATLGGNLCNASPAADSIPTMIVLEGICHIAGPDGRRTVPVENFCVAPGRTVLQPGEFLVSLQFPPPPKNSGARFLRFIPRNEMDIAVVNAAASVVMDDERRVIRSARIAVGTVAPTPLYVPEAGEALVGVEPTPEALERAAEMAKAAARPITDMRGSASQRRHLTKVLTRRALEGAIERARGY